MADKNEDGSVDEITACPDCKGTHLKRDYDHAEIVCADCGLVLEDNIVDTGPEWRAFDMQQENALARAGPPMSTTLPDKGLSTDISPTIQSPFELHDGSRTIVLLPSSSIVIEKSVPLTPTTAVGVLILIFCLLFFAICPDAYLIVPKDAFSDNAPVRLLGSYTNESITNLECSVTSTRV